jgi:hypothetical protein
MKVVVGGGFARVLLWQASAGAVCLSTECSPVCLAPYEPRCLLLAAACLVV